MLTKRFDFDIREMKEVSRDGQNLGIISGFLATFGNFDRGGDTFAQGAFAGSIAEHKSRGNRPIRMLYQHSRHDIIGGFPIDSVKETLKGLEVVGEINLGVSRGADAYALAKQGVLTDMSIGYSVEEEEMLADSKRVIKRAKIWEGSIVDEPMNMEAVITEVKKYRDVAHIKSKKDLEKFLRDVGGCSQKAAKYLVSITNQRDVDSIEAKIGYSAEQIARLESMIKSI